MDVQVRVKRSLLDVVAEVLVADPGASLAEVAEAAGISRTTLHNHYATRDDLMCAVGNRVLDLWEEAVGKAEDGRDGGLGALTEVLLPLCPQLMFLCRNAGLEKHPGLAGAGTRATRASIAVMRRAEERGVLMPGLSDTWLLNSYVSLLIAASGEVRFGRLAPLDAPGRVLSLFLHGIGPARTRRGKSMSELGEAARFATELYRLRASTSWPLTSGGTSWRCCSGGQDGTTRTPSMLGCAPRARSCPAVTAAWPRPVTGCATRCCGTAGSAPAAGRIPAQPAGHIEASLLTMNPPDHTRLRRLALPAFSPKAVATYPAGSSRRSADLLDRAGNGCTAGNAGGPATSTWCSQFAAALPIAVITDLLGIPDGNAAEFAESRRADRQRARRRLVATACRAAHEGPGQDPVTV